MFEANQGYKMSGRLAKDSLVRALSKKSLPEWGPQCGCRASGMGHAW